MTDKDLRYFSRMIEHIHRVQLCMVVIVELYYKDLGLSKDDCRILMYNVLNHDRSKFSRLQFEPYIELTEYYFQRKVAGNKDYEYPPGVAEQVEVAIENHYNSENHHPERFKQSIGVYDKYEAIETVCDLQAMSIEFNEGTCRDYFEMVWKRKQAKHFHDDFNWIETTTLMDKVIQCFEQYHFHGQFEWIQNHKIFGGK